MNIAEQILIDIDSASLAVVRTIYETLVTNNLVAISSMFALALILAGYSLMMGWIEAPAKKIVSMFVKFTLIYALLVNWTFFQAIFYNLFTNLPDQIGGQILSSANQADFNSEGSFSTFIGEFFELGMDATGEAFSSAGWFAGPLLGLVIMLCTVAVTVMILSVVVMSKIAIAVLLALAPVFIIGLIFNISSKMFDSWLQQLMTFTLTVMFTYGVAGFFIILVNTIMIGVAERGEDITASDIAPLAVVSFILVLLIKQVPVLITPQLQFSTSLQPKES